MVARKLRRPWTFAGHELPRGATVAPAISIVHMREDLYPEPARFKPERMIERKPGPFARRTFTVGPKTGVRMQMIGSRRGGR